MAEPPVFVPNQPTALGQPAPPLPAPAETAAVFDPNQSTSLGLPPPPLPGPVVDEPPPSSAPVLVDPATGAIAILAPVEADLEDGPEAARSPTLAMVSPNDAVTSIGAAAAAGRVVAEPPPETDLLAAGTKVGEYEITGVLGAGGMGSVYSARHTVIGRKVAIKVIATHLSQDAGAVHQFVVEARAANQVASRHIVDIHTLGTLPDGRPYLVMELLRGETLTQALARGPMPMLEAMSILEQVAQAVDAAHAARIVHRDLKPDNVFLSKSEDGDTDVKLLDFGIAKLLSSDSVTGDSSPGLSSAGILIGTPHYMAPEQARGESVGPPVDVYGMGLLAYEMVTGESPFPGDTASEILAAHLCAEPPRVTVQRPEAPLVLDALVDAMLAKDPSGRPSASEVRVTVKRVLHALVRSGGEPHLPFRLQARLWLQKPKNRALLTLQIVLGVAMLSAYLFLGDEQPDARASGSKASGPAASGPKASGLTDPAASGPSASGPVASDAQKAPAAADPPGATTAPAPSRVPTAIDKDAPIVDPLADLPPQPARSARRSKSPAPGTTAPAPARAPAPTRTAPAPAKAKRTKDAAIADPFQDL